MNDSVYKLKRDGKVLNSSTNPEEFFESLYSLMEMDDLSPSDTFTTTNTEGFTEGKWFIVYTVDAYNFGVRNVGFTRTLDEALAEAQKVHYGPLFNRHYIYEVEYDGLNTITVVGKVNTQVISTVSVV